VDSGPVVGSSEQGNEPLSSIKCWYFLDSAPFSWLVVDNIILSLLIHFFVCVCVGAHTKMTYPLSDKCTLQIFIFCGPC
jgi:hypothetical protein